jgi:AAA15 family ATPase/GTPase
MRLEISREGVFIPAFNKNKELPATDQISVRYRTPTVAIKNRCQKKPQTKGIASANGRIDHMEIVIEKDGVAMLTEMLVSISNCSYHDGQKEHRITTAQDLINAPVAFEPLLKEITDEFEIVLAGQEIDEKN